MATDPIPLTVSAVVLPPGPLATPQDLANEIVRQLRQGVFLPTGYAFVIGGPMPTADVGPWRPDGASVLWWWDSNYGAYYPEGPAVSVVLAYYGDAEPDGFIFANGQVVDSASYPRLYDKIGQRCAYSPSEGTSLAAGGQFRVPDLRSRFLVGAGTGVDTTAGMVPFTTRVVGTMAGKERRQIDLNELPNPLPVRAYEPDPAQTQGTPRLYGGVHYNSTTATDPDAQDDPGTPSAQGGVPPFSTCNFIIRY